MVSQLSYSHIEQLLPIQDSLKRAFYEVECIKGIWSVRELKRQINSLYFERCGMSLKPELLSEITQKIYGLQHLQKWLNRFTYLNF